MKALVIGGTGLISTALVRQLTERGDNVTVFNRGRAGIPVPDGVQRITGDRADTNQLTATGEFDTVFDMVCYQPSDARGLLEAFRHRAPRIVVASTVDVYQKPATTYPITEDAPTGGVNDYGRGKAECERILLGAHDFPVTILRLVHCYGPGGVHRGHIVHSVGGRTVVLDRLRKGKPVIVHGDGSSLWTSTHIEDVARGFLQAAASNPAIGKAYNLSGDETVTWDQYTRAVAAAIGAPEPDIVHIPTHVLSQLWPDRAATAADNFRFNNVFTNAAAKRDFHFRYTIPLNQGLPPTTEWVERTYGFDNSDDDPFYDKLIGAWRDNLRRMSESLAQ